jgi:predicted RNase H-like HicB family nuclease
MLEYHAAYYRDEKGWYVAKVVDFPGVVTQGKTLREARRMLRHALMEMADWLARDGEPLPRPVSRLKEEAAALVEPIRLGFRVESETRR